MAATWVSGGGLRGGAGDAERFSPSQSASTAAHTVKSSYYLLLNSPSSFSWQIYSQLQPNLSTSTCDLAHFMRLPSSAQAYVSPLNLSQASSPSFYTAMRPSKPLKPPMRHRHVPHTCPMYSRFGESYQGRCDRGLVGQIRPCRRGRE